MIGLDGQHIVRAGVHDLAGDRTLTSHRVNGHDRAFRQQGINQLRYRGDFVALVGRADLPQHLPQTGTYAETR
ncbi:hypothetical protein AWB78_08325 [Caballeronia calidae]|uniref:Uncharacterized protein n=1 Tax=Caballeronia calidae TaxID=1777139 RepID=A0A158EJE4_9BURK|nr:hypothetical protein AWB78_08325 [Caballeronia calidae]